MAENIRLLHSTAYKLKVHIEKYRVGNDPVYLQIVYDLQKQLEDSITLLKNYEKTKISILLENHQGQIFRIFDVTVGTFGKINLRDEEIKLLRSVMDRFCKLFFKTPSEKNKYFKNIPTKIFTEFCKGVTFFENEINTSRPIYHRPRWGGCPMSRGGCPQVGWVSHV